MKYKTHLFTVSLVFGIAISATAQKPNLVVEPGSQSKIELSQFPDLPEELTSFGATMLDNRIFVYGGHTGSAHSYSTAEQSNRFWSLDLDSQPQQAKWEKLPEGPKLQGLALVAVGSKIVRLGGFTAMNAEGEEHDLHSQSTVAAYDPKTKKWSALPPMPEPRSSFDAVAVGTTIYIAGGWNMNGEKQTDWHKTAWSIDLSNENAKWEALPNAPFQCRAVSVAALDRKLFVIGGMQMKSGPTTEVHVFDMDSQKWSAGPKIPGSGMSGFGTAAFATGGGLYVSAMDGFVHKLSKQGDQWRTIAKQEPSRFFHRMLPVSKNKMILLGGANMQIGKFTELEELTIR